MKSATKLFYGLTVFLRFMAVVYISGTQYLQGTGNIINESQGRLEQAGATGLILVALMTLMLGGCFHFMERRSDIAPSDFEGAEIADGVGTPGFSSASSTWPFVMAMGILLMGYDIAFMTYWLIVLDAVILIVTDTKLSTQYTTPPERHQSEYNWTEPWS